MKIQRRRQRWGRKTERLGRPQPQPMNRAGCGPLDARWCSRKTETRWKRELKDKIRKSNEMCFLTKSSWPSMINRVSSNPPGKETEVFKTCPETMPRACQQDKHRQLSVKSWVELDAWLSLFAIRARQCS